jgi:hypothetical protein
VGENTTRDKIEKKEFLFEKNGKIQSWEERSQVFSKNDPFVDYHQRNP